MLMTETSTTSAATASSSQNTESTANIETVISNTSVLSGNGVNYDQLLQQPLKRAITGSHNFEPQQQQQQQQQNQQRALSSNSKQNIQQNWSSTPSTVQSGNIWTQNQFFTLTQPSAPPMPVTYQQPQHNYKRSNNYQSMCRQMNSMSLSSNIDTNSLYQTSTNAKYPILQSNYNSNNNNNSHKHRSVFFQNKYQTTARSTFNFIDVTTAPPSPTVTSSFNGDDTYFSRLNGQSLLQQADNQFLDFNRSQDVTASSQSILTDPLKANPLFWNDLQVQVHHLDSETLNRMRNLPASSNGEMQKDVFSRKVFIGGLPPDIDEDEIVNHFARFGSLIVDWPHKTESKSYFPPKGYAFLIFQQEQSVQDLMGCCIKSEDKYYITVSSPSIKDKAVQIRPWLLIDADYVMDSTQPLDPRRTIFVGGVPRPLKAIELAMIINRLYGGVCYAGIDTDAELKYPKGAGRVAFANQQSYIAAISARFVQLQLGDIDKRVEVKPYVLDDQVCDECQGIRCANKYAPFFCANITCLQYYCELCWASVHSRPGREFHKPLVKEGADRPRAIPFRWC